MDSELATPSDVNYTDEHVYKHMSSKADREIGIDSAIPSAAVGQKERKKKEYKTREKTPQHISQ